MATFSERYGYKPVRAMLGQFESMDEGLRVAIWDFFCRKVSPFRLSAILDQLADIPYIPRDFPVISPDYGALYATYKRLTWHEVYNFVEDCVNAMSMNVHSTSYSRRAFSKEIEAINMILEKEGSAYRILNHLVVPISNTEEILTVEEAAISSDYISKAIELFSNREHPDSANVIKESIAAVEYAVQKTTGLDTVKGLEKLALHPQLAQAWKNMYRWASQEPGVRHPNTGKPRVGVAEARYVLVAASAFVNYLKSKGYLD